MIGVDLSSCPQDRMVTVSIRHFYALNYFSEQSQEESIATELRVKIRGGRFTFQCRGRDKVYFRASTQAAVQGAVSRTSARAS
jgi:hypothetical protein